MKNLLLIIFICISSKVGAQVKGISNSYKLIGIIKNINKGKIFMKHTDFYGKWVTDSTEIFNGNFIFNGNVNIYNNNALLYLKEITEFVDDEPNATRIELENSTIRIDL